MEAPTPYEELAARLVELCEDLGAQLIIEPLGDGWHGVALWDGEPGSRVGPFLTEETARAELAFATLESHTRDF